jgi:sulfate adenylyltransferase
MERLMELDDRSVLILDGDHVRQLLSSELGFSTDHRNLNIKRIGYVASEAVRPGGAVIAAPIAPYETSRKWARDAVEKYGGFVEVHLSTKVEVAEQRDRKGLYKKARQGLLKNFTGLDDPYEAPRKPEIRIDTGMRHVPALCWLVLLC